MLAVDCKPLRRRRTWLVLGRFDGEAGPDEVRVVVPPRVADRFRPVLAADDVEALVDGWELRAVRSHLDRGGAAEQVEQLLLAAYQSAFEETPQREGP